MTDSTEDQRGGGGGSFGERVILPLMVATTAATAAHGLNLLAAVRFKQSYPFPGLFVPISFGLVFAICMFPGLRLIVRRRLVEGLIVTAVGFGLGWVAFLVGTVAVSLLLSGTGSFS